LIAFVAIFYYLMNVMEESLISVYEKNLEQSVKQVDSVLKNIGVVERSVEDNYRKILIQSCSNITDKWKSGRKYARTSFIKEAYGSSYPEGVFKDSIFIDAMVNILDDLLDEDLKKNEKKLYVLEFLRIFASHNFELISSEAQALIGSYFYKLISLAIIENYYDNLLNSERDIEKLIGYSCKVLDCRSMDIDIFSDLALLNSDLVFTNEEKSSLTKISRIFRALNIIKKDIDDMEHDKATGQESLILKVYTNNPNDFYKYVSRIVEHYKREAAFVLKNEQGNIIFVNFYNMIEAENKKILINIK